MSFRLTSLVTIGNYSFAGGINDCEIKRSVKEIVDTAVLKIPAIGRVNGTLTQTNSSVVTSTLFNEGDPVTIQLGYNYDFVTEFKGFVRRVDPSIPVKIECEGYAWQLRRKRLVGNYPNINLKDFLVLVVAGTGVKLSQYIPDIPLTNLKVDHPNCLKVLEYLKDKCCLAAYFLYDTLYVGLEEGVPASTGIAPSILKVPMFRLGWNTMRDDKLKWRLASDEAVQVQLVQAKGKNAKRPFYKYGDADGGVIKRELANITDPAWMANIAQAEYQQAVYTGYEGSITGFLQPYIQMCDATFLSDPLYNVRQGSYFTQGTHVKFGVSGATREVFIGRSLTGASPLTAKANT